MEITETKILAALIPITVAFTICFCVRQQTSLQKLYLESGYIEAFDPIAGRMVWTSASNSPARLR